jgi:hypothetical protein
MGRLHLLQQHQQQQQQQNPQRLLQAQATRLLQLNKLL